MRREPPPGKLPGEAGQPFPAGAIGANTGWLLADRLARMAGGFLVGVWLARYLGPGDYGILSYALALSALFSIFPRAGTEEIVIHDLVSSPGHAAAVLGGAFRLKAAGALAGFGLSVGTAALLRPGDGSALATVALVSGTLLFQPAEIFGWYFQARLQSRYPVVARGAAFLAATGLKVALILAGAPLVVLAGAFLLEAALGFTSLALLFRARAPAPGWFRAGAGHALSAWRRSWPVALAGFCALVYTRIDKVMLARLAGDAAVGHYAAAGRIAELWYYLPMTALVSTFPALVAARARAPGEYRARLQRAYDRLSRLSLAGSLALAVSARWLIGLLFGPAFSGSGPVLEIQAWSAVPALALALKAQWAVMENLQKHNLACLATAALLNFLLNLALIPAWGGRGAAAATLAAQFSALLLVPLFNRRDRESVAFWLRSLDPRRAGGRQGRRPPGPGNGASGGEMRPYRDGDRKR